MVGALAALEVAEEIAEDVVEALAYRISFQAVHTL